MKMADAIIVSFPKAGRTWLAMILSAIFQEKYNLNYQDITSLEKITYPCPQLPNITLIHEDNPQIKTPNELSTNKNKLLKKKIIFLIRDPRDIIVSWYFHLAHRKQKYKGELSAFLNIPIGGFNTIIKYYNIWNKYKKHPHFLKVSYENLMNNSIDEIRKILNFLSINISDEDIKKAIDKCSFEKMRKLEEQNIFNVNRLKPGDINDPESFKLRRGKIRGYKDYLSENQIDELNSYLQNLNLDDRRMLNIP